MNLLMDFFTFHKNIPGWKVDFPGTFYICHHIREWILYPFRDVLGTCLLRCPCGFSGKELLGLASENPVEKLRKIHIDKKNPLIKLLPC